MTAYGYNNPASQLDRKRILEESKKPTTFHKLAQSTDPESLGGRYATGANIHPGTHPHVNYPPLPEGNPWSSGPQPGIEPPTGVEVDALEPTGTFEEIQRSIANSASTRDAETSSSNSLLLEDELGPEHGSVKTLQPAQGPFPSPVPGGGDDPRLANGGPGSSDPSASPSGSGATLSLKRRTFSK